MSDRRSLSWRRALSWLPTVATGALTVASLCFLVATLLGVRLLPVLTGSMTPYAPAGSLAVTVPVHGDDVRVGDVIAFRAPPPFRLPGDRPVFHRVVALGHVDGRAFMTTRGDANPGVDPWRVSLREADLGRAVFDVPHAGRLVAAGPFGAVLLLGGCAVVWFGLARLRALDHERVESIPLHARTHRAY